MFKKVLPIVLAVCLLSLTGCSKKSESLSVDRASEPTPVVSEPEKQEVVLNPLTGLDDVTKKEAANRPVAIMINNISIAQPVQTGLNDADVIYETEVEGGITRLLAVFQDVANVKKLGTIRSARNDYIDLAMGHNAIYAYHGSDPNYARPRLKNTDSFTVGTSNGGVRVSNGLASEHTLYAYGDKIWESIKDSDRTIKNKNNAMWLNFADIEEKVTYENKATDISVEFSAYYTTNFKYDEETGRYTRYFRDEERKDYETKESVTVKNVFVLNTKMGQYPKPKYRKIHLEEGTGFYCVNGTYTPITWSKGDESNPFVFKDSAGEELKVNAGNSWICIVDKENNQPEFK